MSCVRYVNQSTQCQLLYMEMRYTAYWGCSFTHQIVFIIIWPSKNSPTHIPWLSSCSDQLPTFLNTKHAKRHSVYLSNKFTCFLKRLDFWSTALQICQFHWSKYNTRHICWNTHSRFPLPPMLIFTTTSSRPKKSHTTLNWGKGNVVLWYKLRSCNTMILTIR